MDYTFFNNVPGAIPKGTPRRIVKARKDRQEARIKRVVRAECVKRDGLCRYWHDVFAACFVSVDCSGPSEWAHLERSKRARTRGMKPELRHTTAGTVMLCRFHHAQYDAGTITVKLRTNRGADGTLEWRAK